MSFFSIIIPTHNRADLLRQALTSVQKQTFQDFECWVIDDASTDETPAVIQEFLKDSRFRTIRNDTNRRQHFCRNRAIEKATAPWITFLDSDDVWLPNRLQAFADVIHAAPDIGFWFSNGFWLEEGKVVGRFFEENHRLPHGAVTAEYVVSDRFPPHVTTNVALRRECFDRFRFFREDMQILEDTEFYVRVLSGGTKVGAIPECLSLYRLHPSQITRNYETQFDEFVMALKAAHPGSEVPYKRLAGLVRSTALFLLKSLRPGAARAFLSTQRARRSNLDLWLATYLPVALLTRCRTLYRTRFFFSDPRSLAGAREAETFYREVEGSLGR